MSIWNLQLSSCVVCMRNPKEFHIIVQKLHEPPCSPFCDVREAVHHVVM